MVTRAGSFIPVGTVLGLFAGTTFMGNEPRGANALALPTFHVDGVEIRCFVDGLGERLGRCAAPRTRRPSSTGMCATTTRPPSFKLATGGSGALSRACWQGLLLASPSTWL